MSIVFWFIVKELGKGIMIGCFLRSLWSFLFKTEMTPGGFFRFGIVFGIIYLIITFIAVMQL